MSERIGQLTSKYNYPVFPQRMTGLPKPQIAIGPLMVLLAVAAFGFLALTASQQAYSATDLEIAQWVRSLDAPGLDATLRVVNVFTDAHVAIALWVIAGAFFVLRGRPMEAIAVFLISGLWVGDALLSALVNRPSPAAELMSVVDFSRSASFPSGHVTGAVAFYGILTYLTLNNARGRLVRMVVPTLSVLVIGLASLGRVYASAHWPSDVLGSYILGGLGVAAIASLYIRVKEDRLHRPHLRKKKPAPQVQAPAGIKIAHSIASTVYLDPQAGTAAKEYNPPAFIRALHRVSFQAPFSYQHNRDSLEAAAAKRVVVGLLSQHWFGKDIMAKFYEIRETENGYQFVTEFIAGEEPASNMEIADTLSEIYTYFQQVGFATWQIAPGNPHAYSNFIRTAEGDLKLIDLESALVSISYPWQELRAALRDGYFPAFDDVDFSKMRGYVQNNAQALTESLGREGFARLESAIDDAEHFTREWKESEPRVWGRLARRVYRMLDVSRLFKGIRGKLDGAETMAKSFVSGAIERWESEGKIDGEQAAVLRGTMATPEAQTLMKHMGAHLILSVAIAIPIPGLRSAARFGWTLAFRLKAMVASGLGKISKEEYQVARSIHSVPVMSEPSAMPSATRC